MSQRFTEGRLALVFPDEWHVTKYDAWDFFLNQFQKCGEGKKAVDFVGFDPAEKQLWLIELKDYRGGRRRNKDISLWDEVAIKAHDTVAGLLAAKVDTGHNENAFAVRVHRAEKRRVVLHLEQTVKPSKLFPRAFDPADVPQKLRQLVKAIDAHPLVIETSEMRGVPWYAERI